MDGERARDVEAIFSGALSRSSSAERRAYLDGACGEDVKLKDRVLALLKAHEKAEGFLETPAVEREDGLSPGLEKPGTLIGPYKLLQLIGEGGFGAVYMAEQEEPVRRRVALKIIKLGMDTKQVIARFEAERQALALLDHPNIAKVLDAGATEAGRPYFVMELVRGIALNDYCDKLSLATAERLELFISVCQAVQHAHQKGIIHRDLKPTNVLVTLHDGRPVPMVIDFGIARATNQRLTQKTLFTEFGQFIGTPEYMSPEQAEMSGLDIDTRTDIYSLGVILYELLTGTTPIETKTFRERGLGRLQQIIREEEPPIPSTRVTTLGDELTEIARHRRVEPRALSRLIRGDLDWIVMRALEKDRTRRYATAKDMADDVRRHLEREPVTAGPPGVVYKLRKFVLRHRVGVVAGSFVAGALLVGLALATVGLVQARREAVRSQKIADFLAELLITTDAEGALGQEVDVARVVATAREVFGDDHATVAATLRSRALQLQSAGNLVAAEPLYRESLRLWREHYGDGHADVAVTNGLLGRLLELKGDHAAAEAALREAVAHYSGLPGEQQVVGCDTLNSLAGVLITRAEYEEAEALLRESLRIRREYAPHQKLSIAFTVNSLANTLIVAGKDEEAVPLAVETLEAYRRALPEGSTFLARVAASLAKWLLEVGEDSRAEEFLREALRIYRANPGAAPTENHLARAYLYHVLKKREADVEEILELGEQLVETAPEVVGEDSPRYGALLQDHGCRLARHGRHAEGLAHLVRAVPLLDCGPECEGELDCALRTIALSAWRIAADPDRPREEYELALRAAELHVEHRPEIAAVVNTVGVLQYRLGLYEDALETLARSDAQLSLIYEGGAPADVAFIAMAHAKLGHADRARAAVARLRDLVEKPEHAMSEESRGFLEEAEALIRSE